MPPDEYDVVTTLRAGRQDRSDATEFDVRVVAGPDAGKAFLVRPDDPSPALVGKGPACTVLLTDPEVSRRHASLEAEGAALRIVDLGSTNGTFVNGQPVRRVTLADGTQVTLGRTTLVFRRDGIY